MTLKKTQPQSRCYIPGYKQCWVCQVPKQEVYFQFDEEACDLCYVSDLQQELADLKTKKKPGRPKKKVEDSDKGCE